MNAVDSRSIKYTPLAVRLGAVALLIGAGFVLGIIMGNGEERGPASHGAGGASLWTCSMHPQIQLPDPDAKCPICGMDLIPMTQSGGDDLGPRVMTMSKEAAMLAEIQTQKAERRFVNMEIPLVGKVDYDETRVKTISAWVPGRLDRLYVDYTGVPVRTGDHLVEMYSPELYTTQEELIQALKTVESLKNSENDFIRRTALKNVEATREKLSLLGLTGRQIARIEEQDDPSATVEIKAPIGGIVIEMHAKEGMYVKTGTPIYTVADLSKVWVRLDAYESDIPWIRYGQEVEIRTEAYGDRVFTGWISFIDPVLDPKTRTVKVRVIVENSKGELRPNMFVRARVKARAGEDQLVSENLADKFVCPMHPEIIKDDQGFCDECGMDLVKAKELGYTSEEEAEPPLVVPASAVLTTGKRGVVYVRVPGADKPTFQGVEVELGLRAGDYYIIQSGLEEGQEVVTHGNFKIDSALQLSARPSMMSPMDHGGMHKNPALGVKPVEGPADFIRSLTPLYDAYLAAQTAFAADDEARGRKALDDLARALENVDSSRLAKKAARGWKKLSKELAHALSHRDHAEGFEEIRNLFIPVSDAVIRMEASFGHTGAKDIRLAFCPMAASDMGAHWLQEGAIINNPFFGSAMLRCGEIQDTFPGRVEKPEALKRAVTEFFREYIEVQKALGGDSPKEAGASADRLLSLPVEEKAAELDLDTLEVWKELKGNLVEAARFISEERDIQKQREHFVSLSGAMESMVRRFGPMTAVTVRRFYCPMAFDNKGAYWLQEEKIVLNPFFGSAMLRCGEMIEVLSQGAEGEGGGGHDH